MMRVILGLSLALLFGVTAWLPHVAAQNDTYMVLISALNCPTEEVADEWSPANPDSECDQGLGVTFTVADANSGADYGSCVSDWMPPSMGIGCSFDVPVGAVVSVTEDTTALPAGYLPVENPIVTALPAEGEPARARFVNVLQSEQPPAEAPPAQVPELYDLPIQVTNCTVVPAEPSAVPVEGCESAPGISFTVTDANTGEVYGSCESAPLEDYDFAQCRVTVPVGSTVVVTEDTSTVPAGYAPRENPVTREILEAAIRAGEGAYAPFQNVLETAPPAGEEPTPPPTQLPSTGTGSSGLNHLMSFFR